MKLTVKQLKALIREAAQEAMNEMKEKTEEVKKEEVKTEEVKKEEEGKMSEKLQEAIAEAFRAGYRRGKASRW